MVGFFINILPMKSFRQYINEVVSRRPERTTVQSLHTSGGFKPDETGHINLTTYHTGNLGEDEKSPLSPKSIVFPSFADNIFIARPQNMAQMIRDRKMTFTANQPRGSDYGFSTTPDALSASMYRGNRGFVSKPQDTDIEKTYEINAKVHEDNIKHFDTWHSMNEFLAGNDKSSPFHPDHPRHNEYLEFAMSHPTHGDSFRKIIDMNDQHAKMIDQAKQDFKKTEIGSQNPDHLPMDERIKYNLAEQEHMAAFYRSKPLNDLVAAREKIKKSLPSGIFDQVRSKFLSDRMGLHVLTSRSGSSRAAKSGEIMILSPSVITGVNNVTDQINSVRNRYVGAMGHRLFPVAQKIARKNV